MIANTSVANTYTSFETVQTSDGNTILYSLPQVANFFKTEIEENFILLTNEEKQEFFELQEKYYDILTKVFTEPLHITITKILPVGWIKQDSKRNPIEEYEYTLQKGQDADISNRHHRLKMQRLNEHKIWFENKDK